MVTVVNEVSLIIKVEKKDKFEVKMGTVTGMTEVCCANHQIYCKAINGEIQVKSYRGNKPGWENITGKWIEYAKQITERMLPEDFMKMLGMSSDDKPIDNVNDCFDGGDSVGDSAVSTVVNTTSSIADDARSGAEVLKEAIAKNPKHVQEKINILARYTDNTEADLEKVMNDPNYAAVQNLDGSHTLISKANIEVRTMALKINESKNIVPHIYIYNSENGYTSNMVAIQASNVRNGGSKFKNELKNIEGHFTDEEIGMAYFKLWRLVWTEAISTVDDESKSYSDILSKIKDYIEKQLNKRYDDTKDGHSPSVIVEKKDSGLIVVGIRNKDFDKKYEKLIKKSLVMSERAFKKQAKMLGDMIPDAGRGGGDHILGEKYCSRYGMKPKERMQRINYSEGELEELWIREEAFRKSHPDVVEYDPKKKEKKS